MEAQGFNVNDNVLYQYKNSTILLEEKEKNSSNKSNWVINISYFFITDNIER